MSTIKFEPVETQHPALDNLLTEFSSAFVDGGALLRSFSVPVDAGDWLAGSIHTIVEAR